MNKPIANSETKRLPQSAIEAKKREEKAALKAGEQFDGEDMELVRLPNTEIRARMDEPGYDGALNPETRRRRYASKFHKNVYSRWSKVDRRYRQAAADEYLEHCERAESGFSSGGYDGSLAPEFYEPKVFPAVVRAKSAEWIRECNKFVGKRFARILRQCMVQHMSVSGVYYFENPHAKKSKRTAYRSGGAIVDLAFDKLAEFCRECDLVDT